MIHWVLQIFDENNKYLTDIRHDKKMDAIRDKECLEEDGFIVKRLELSDGPLFETNGDYNSFDRVEDTY